MTYILKINQLIKSFKGKEVVSNISMKVKKGKFYGFLGPNGASKTIIMKIITNLIKTSSEKIYKSRTFLESLKRDLNKEANLY